ncbi:peptide/nickel transport system ATP-binding protein [Kitasatospora sp. MAA4]|uniref:ABC transporter ATP-binding protein n=1 Tax=Kitasatospora sp. MAA4 TaxID=3035093 RepID=UPI00247620AB|nr:ABC transporter ATP-binding protein [Kitasatospora sp. MAA4]MDH6131505.1 peptide/nickel transport system ATP-binding protein [Kitasatospora sp. MAA4]
MTRTLDIKSLRLRLPDTARPVLDGVDLHIAAGETVALVGESGSGKTLTSRTVLRLLPKGAETEGEVDVAGENVLAMTPQQLHALRTGRVAMIFQDPRAAINPLRRVGDFLTEGVRLTGTLSEQDATRRAGELLEAVGLSGAVLRHYPGQMSGGMLQRVMIAAALMGDPVLLLADEPTTALDVTSQAEVVALIGELKERFGTGLLFVTHDLGLAAAISDRVYVMYAGRIVETGPAEALFADPRHPYTRALLDASPRLIEPGRRLAAIDGQPPDLRQELTGCPFAPRCRFATGLCTTQAPQPQAAPGAPGHLAACHHSDRLAEGAADA